MNYTNINNPKGGTMKEKFGILVNHDFGIEIHREDCKDFLRPKNHTTTIGDYPVKEQIRIPLELNKDTNFNESEDLKKLTVTLSDNFWGAESILYDPVIYTCTKLVNRKTYTELNYGFAEGRYDSIIDNDHSIFISLVNKDEWFETRKIDGYDYTGFKDEYYEGLSR